MNLIGPAFGLAAIGGAALWYIRLASSGSEGGRLLDGFAFAASFCTSMGITLAAVAAFLAATPTGWFSTTTITGAAGNGAVLGATLVFCVRVLLLEGATHLWHWSRRRRPEIERSLSEFLATTSLLLAGAAVAFALFFGGIHVAAPYGKVAWLLVPAFLALIPMYETFIQPWVRYARAPTLAAERLTDIEGWIEKVRAERGLPRVHVRVQNGPYRNAFAIGGLGAHLVVVGQALVEELSASHLQAVIAHEIAHVARKDVPRLLVPIVAATTLHSVGIVHVSNPLFQTGQVWGYFGGALFSGLSFCALVMMIPGFCMRRMEFAADRLAVELLGSGEPLAQALERICELSHQPLTKRTWSHPPMKTRIDAIRSLSN